MEQKKGFCGEGFGRFSWGKGDCRAEAWSFRVEGNRRFLLTDGRCSWEDDGKSWSHRNNGYLTANQQTAARAGAALQVTKNGTALSPPRYRP